MAAKKKSAPAVELFSEEVLEAARQFRSIKLAPLPKKLRGGDKAAQIRKGVRAYVRERMPRS